MFTGFPSTQTPSVQWRDFSKTHTGEIKIALSDDCAPIQYFATGGNYQSILVTLPTNAAQGKTITFKNDKYAANSQLIQIFDPFTQESNSYPACFLGQGGSVTFCYIFEHTLKGFKVANWVIISGGSGNGPLNYYSAALSGLASIASGQYAVVAGGQANTASNYATTVSGGYNVTASGYAATAGGYSSYATGSYAFALGYACNASTDYSIAMGNGSTASTNNRAISIGSQNTSSGGYSFVIGSHLSTSSSYFSHTLGGAYNVNTGYASTISGGTLNTAPSATAVGTGTGIVGFNGDTAFGLASSPGTLRPGLAIYQDNSVFGYPKGIVLSYTNEGPTFAITGSTNPGVFGTTTVQHAGGFAYAVGSAITINVNPTNYNGTYRVNASSVGSVTFNFPNYLSVGSGTIRQASSVLTNTSWSGTNFGSSSSGLSVSFYAGHSYIGGGYANSATGALATIVGGLANTASGDFSSVLGGSNGNTRSITGYTVFPASGFPIANATGVSQSGLLVLGVQTADATSTVLRSNYLAATTTNQVILPNNSAYYLKGSIVAGVTAAGNTAAWSFEAVIKRGANAAATSIVQSVVNVVGQDSGASAWAVAITADTTNGGLAITATGQAATTIRWVAKVETTEMTY